MAYWRVLAYYGQLVLSAGLHNHRGEWKQASGKSCKHYAMGTSEALAMLGSPAGRMGGMVSSSCELVGVSTVKRRGGLLGES